MSKQLPAKATRRLTLINMDKTSFLTSIKLACKCNQSYKDIKCKEFKFNILCKNSLKDLMFDFPKRPKCRKLLPVLFSDEPDGMDETGLIHG